MTSDSPDNEELMKWLDMRSSLLDSGNAFEGAANLIRQQRSEIEELKAELQEQDK